MSYKYSKGAQIIGDLSGSDDANRDTGIDFEENYIGFEAGGSTIMVVSGSAVGIGTTTPDYELDVAGNIGLDEYIYHNGDADTYIQFPGATNQINLVANTYSFLKYDGIIKLNAAGRDRDTQVFAQDDSVVLHVDAGNAMVGIGTDTPDYTLDVAGNIGVDQYIYHNGDADTNINFTDDRIRFKAGGMGFVGMHKKSSSPHQVTINNGNNNIDFVVNSNNNSNDPILRCDASAASVGIRTASPIAELDVAGKIAITAESSTPSQPSDGQGYLYTKSDGKIYWRSYDVSETDLTAGGGGGSTDPAGSDEQVQFNDGGSFGGDSGLLFNKTSNILTVEKVSFADVSGISNDTASGEIVKFGSGTLTAGKLYYLHTDGAWTLADADSTTAGSTQLLGIALGSSPTSNGMLVKGMFDMHSYFSGSFSTGQPVYLSTDAGKISTSEITTEGKVRRLVGYCTNASNVIYFNPESTYTDNITIPYPKYYFDGSSTNTQMGDNSLTNATIATDNGKYENGFIDFGASGNTNPALFGNAIDLASGIYTFSFWFYSKRTGSDWGSILRRASGGSPVNTQDYPILTEDSSDELGMYTEAGGQFYSTGYDMTSLEGSTSWVHMAVVANGSQSKFYINGSQAGDPVAQVVSTSVSELGAYDGNDTQVFSEGIDEFAFWSIALTPDQIAKIYNSSTKLIKLVT